MGGAILYIILAFFLLVVVVFLCIIKPASKKHEYSDKRDNIYVGMSEEDLIQSCGMPSKTIVIDDDCKLVSYTLDEWKGVLFGGSTHHEITATIKQGKVTNISSSD